MAYWLREMPRSLRKQAGYNVLVSKNILFQACHGQELKNE